MTDFDYDVRQKTIIARGAKHKKGSVFGPRGCRLPSDNLTDAQRKKLNGKEERFVLNRPITWNTFLAYPEDMQKEYITKLRDTLDPSAADLSLMFGVTGEKVRKKLIEIGLPLRRRGRVGREHKQKWQTWLDEWNRLGTPVFTWSAAPADPVSGAALDDAAPSPKAEPTSLEMLSTSLIFVGEYSPEALTEALSRVAVPEGRVCIEITIKEEGDAT